MNITTLVAALVALITGITAGTTFSNNDTLPPPPPEPEVTQSDVVAAQDFVSLRPSITAQPHEAVSEDETTDLLFMREEEKLARDVYQTLYETWGESIFSNIAQSEQTHTEAIRSLLEKYSITDPVRDDTVGIFQNAELQALYTTLVEQGNRSITDALTVGATIEDLDLRDLEQAIARTDNSDIALVYENLTRGSRNHLRAFSRQLDARNVSYTPQYISADAYTTITESETETGAGAKRGGRGWGWGHQP